MSVLTDKQREKLFREKELAFFGAVTASISHELNNAMAIIEQAAGLLEDLILGSEGAGPIPNEQLQKIADRINKQTKRGATIIRRLNGFAHSVDVAEKELELNDTAQNVAHLAHRMAERKRVLLEVRDSQDRLTVSTSPFRAQQAIYLSIRQAVSMTSEGAKVVISAGSQDSRVWVSVESPRIDSSEKLELTYLEMLMQQLGGTVEVTSGRESLSIRLIFPKK